MYAVSDYKIIDNILSTLPCELVESGSEILTSEQLISYIAIFCES